MNKKTIITILLALVAMTGQAQTTQKGIINGHSFNELPASINQRVSSIIGRPYKAFDTSAFCVYNKFHPSQYLTDNNWDILCAFVQPGTSAKLDSLGINY